MTPRLVVIGTSAGGLAPLRAIVGTLPADLRATVLVVMHLSSTAGSVLPEILARVAQVGVAPASHELQMRPGRVIVAPPDRHLTVLSGRVCLGRGARENGHRPAVDPLFRTAAEQYGPATCGVLLSGSGDDGAVGLAQIRNHGGVTIVQDPSDAQYDGMPANALAATDVDLVLRAEDIGPALVGLVRGELELDRVRRGTPSGVLEEPDVRSIVCPDCGGSLFESDEAGVVSFRCHVGHRYALRSLLAAHADAVERAMWTAVRNLEDRAMLLRDMAARADRGGMQRTARRYRTQADATEDQAVSIRSAIGALDDSGIEPPAGGDGGRT